MMTTRLFPDFADKINAVSGDNKFGVKQLYAALEKAVERMALPLSVYAIVDRDTDLLSRPKEGRRMYEWDVYHIENYLLEPKFIRTVLREILHSEKTLLKKIFCVN